MASERVIDLGNKRYADREYTGELPPSTAAAEQAARQRRELALARLRRRVREPPGGQVWLTRSDLLDLLLVLGEDDW
jgi:hypothetical protein